MAASWAFRSPGRSGCPSATPEQRANYRIEEFGAAIHWPDVDEEIGLTRFLGVSEDVLYDASGFNPPTRSTEEYLALAE
jgi:hypothetical protein